MSEFSEGWEIFSMQLCLFILFWLKSALALVLLIIFKIVFKKKKPTKQKQCIHKSTTPGYGVMCLWGASRITEWACTINALSLRCAVKHLVALCSLETPQSCFIKCLLFGENCTKLDFNKKLLFLGNKVTLRSETACSCQCKLAKTAYPTYIISSNISVSMLMAFSDLL